MWLIPWPLDELLLNKATIHWSSPTWSRSPRGCSLHLKVVVEYLSGVDLERLTTIFGLFLIAFRENTGDRQTIPRLNQISVV
jgi:hypothetical protein